MIQKTKGIVLSYVKYKDSSIIVRIFTEQFGSRSYMVNGVRKKNKGNKLIFYQALNLVDLVVYENEKRDINRISEIRFFHQPQSIPFNVVKSAIAIFVCEFLEKIIFAGEENQLLYNLLEQSLIDFDSQEKDYENFPIFLLIKLTTILGINIDAEGSNSKTLDLLLKKDVSKLNGETRKELLEELIQHYNRHLGTSRQIKSLEVLSTVLG